MSPLDTKLVRELVSMRGQVLTIALVVGAGIAVTRGGRSYRPRLSLPGVQHLRGHEQDAECDGGKAGSGAANILRSHDITVPS